MNKIKYPKNYSIDPKKTNSFKPKSFSENNFVFSLTIFSFLVWQCLQTTSAPSVPPITLTSLKRRLKHSNHAVAKWELQGMQPLHTFGEGVNVLRCWVVFYWMNLCIIVSYKYSYVMFQMQMWNQMLPFTVWIK